MGSLKYISLAFFVVVATIGLMVTPARAITLNIVDEKLVGASDVEIGADTFYNVSFVDGTCIELFNGCNDNADFAFSSMEQARAAAYALFDQVFIQLFDSNPALTFGCERDYSPNALNQCASIIPFGPATELMEMEMYYLVNNLGSDYLGKAQDFHKELNTLYISNWNYAKFTPVSAIPLPPSAILFATALLGLAGLRKKKRKA